MAINPAPSPSPSTAGGSTFVVAQRREGYASINATCFCLDDIMPLIHMIRQIRQIRISPFLIRESVIAKKDEETITETQRTQRESRDV
jgi:hypothetical protein